MYEIITKEQIPEYEAFVQSHPKGNFAQSWLWSKQKPRWDWDAVAVRGEDGKIKGTMALMTRKVPGIGRTLMYGCRAPVCDLDDRETFAQLLEGATALAKQKKAYVIKIDPDVPSSDTAFAEMRRSFGFLSGSLVLDTDHRLLRFNAGDSFVFGPENLKSFRITEDGRPLFEARDGVLYCHYSDVPDRVTAMQPAIDRFYMDVHDYERMEEMDRRMHRDDDDHRPVRFRPTFDMKEPVEKFAVELTLAHPYWHSFREEIGAPDFDSYNPSAAEYLNEYEDDVNGLHELAAALLHIMDASGTEQWDEDPYAASASAASADSASVAAAAAAAAVAAVQQSAAPVDTVAEIQKYKALLDAGVLTEEEFAAKKKQLLGI